ncbi:hypothetical protein ABPG74_007349 [Tetrahymena malaccensis]
MKQQVVQQFSSSCYSSQQQQHQQFSQKSLSKNQQFHPSYSGMPPNHIQHNFQNQYSSRNEEQFSATPSADKSLVLQGNCLNYSQQQPVFQNINQNQHQEHLIPNEEQVASNPQQLNFDHHSYIINSGNNDSHQGHQQQRMASRFYVPHNLGFYQNNQQQDMSIQQSNYQQQQQIQINQQFISSQSFDKQNFQLNMCQKGEDIFGHQSLEQGVDQSTHIKNQYQQHQQQYSQQQQQQHNSFQNSKKQFQTRQEQNQSCEKHNKEKNLQQLEEQGSPSSVLLVIVFELNELQITNDQLQQIFSPYGFVNKVLIFQKSIESTKAFIEMDNVESAKKAKEALNKAKIPLLPNQKYKFKVHYSQTTDLNLCNYKTEGMDYRLQPNKITNSTNQNTVSSNYNCNQIDSKFQQQKLQAKKIDMNHGAQCFYPQNKNQIQGNLDQKKQSLNINHLPSSSSISSPKNLQSQQQNNFSYTKTSNQQNRNQQVSHNSHGLKNISNSIGQTIGAITYIEKSQSNPPNQDELIQQQQYQATVAPPNNANPQNLIMQPHLNNQFSANSQFYNQTMQPYSQSLQSLTSTSTPTSQGNITLGSSTIHNKISSSQTNIGSIRRESVTYFSPVTFQMQGGIGLNQQFQEENGNKEELDCFKSPFDQKYEITNTGNSNAITTSKTFNIGKGDSNNRQGSCSMLPTKLESFESFNQIQEQGSSSIQNLPEFNLQQGGQQNMNNPSTLSQSLTDISPRKGSLVFLNSDMVAHQQNYQDNYYSQMNSQFSQVLQQKDYKIPSQSYIGPQSMIDITQNSKSTCSTSSPSPFHTVTSPTYPNSCKNQLYQQITRLDSLQLNQVDLSSNNISSQYINTTNPSQGYINNHLNKQYSHPPQSQQQLIQQQHQQQFPSSTPLIQENSLDQSFSSGVALSNNNFQDDPNNSSTLKSKNSLSTQSKDQSENFPLQALSHLGQQQQTEESPVIYVKNIKINEVTPVNVYNIFRNFGYVHSILFLREKKTVLIQYEEVSQAKMAINQLNNMSFQGDEQMRISYAKHKTIIVRQNQVSKTSQHLEQQQQNDKNNQKQYDYFENKYNDPRSRAGNQNNKKNNFYNPVSKTVYVTNIPIQLIKKEQDFLDIFKPYGQVTKHNISKQDKKVTAFVEFDTFQSALNSICFLHNKSYHGKLIQIFFTRSMIK